jgi:general secretion pathway protein M
MSALGKLRERITALLRRPLGYLEGEWERLAPRQKRTYVILAVSAVVALIAVITIFTLSDISDLEDGNATIRDALTAISKHRDEYLEAKSRNSVQEARIGTDPPQLAGDLEAAARAENVQIAESSERPTVPAGRRYVEHDTDLKIRETDLQSLTRFLKRVETGPRLIFFTRLSIKHRYSDDSDKLDAELTATAFERVHEGSAKKKPDGQKSDGQKSEGQ